MSTGVGRRRAPGPACSTDDRFDRAHEAPRLPRRPRLAPVPRGGLGSGVPVPAHRRPRGRPRVGGGDPAAHRRLAARADRGTPDARRRPRPPGDLPPGRHAVLRGAVHADRDRRGHLAGGLHVPAQRRDAALHRRDRDRLLRPARRPAGRRRPGGRGRRGARARRVLAVRDGRHDAPRHRGRARRAAELRGGGQRRPGASRRRGAARAGDRHARRRRPRRASRSRS